MGIYSRYIFPRILDFSLSQPWVNRHRAELLAGVEGEILEIGFGTGLNLPFYPEHITRIVTVDANAGMNPLAEKRMATSHIQVDHRVLNAERLPFEDNYFDSVVSTWTLCSIARIDDALAEVRRVLKPQGRFFFCEHGLSPEQKIQTWQNRLNPLQRIVGDGCNMNRNIRALIEKQGFAIISIDQFYLEKTPKIFGYLYKGVAEKRAD